MSSQSLTLVSDSEPKLRTCNKVDCAQVNPQPLEAFNKDKECYEGRSPRCKACKRKATKKKPYKYAPYKPEDFQKYKKRKVKAQKKHNLFKRYGLTWEGYCKRLENQEHKCAICGEHESQFLKGLNVDHNHITGEVRGLLCFGCNAAIGKLKTDEGTKLLEKAIEYIKKSEIK